MDLIVDIVNSIFIISSTYFTVLFLLLFFHHEERIMSRPKMKKFPSVSIVIPAFNEEKIIERVIDNVKKLTYPRKKEIIVVDDGSTDRTWDVLKKIKGIRTFRKKNGGRASAVNYGLKKARGEIFVRIDADSFPERGCISHNDRPNKEPEGPARQASGNRICNDSVVEENPRVLGRHIRDPGSDELLQKGSSD